MLNMTTTEHVNPRGITNASRVSCHLTCALQLLIHGVEPLRESLIEISRSKEQHDDGDAFLLQLGSFFDSYSHPHSTTGIDGDDAAQDPSSLYKTMQETTSIDPHHLGDAVTALRRILQALRASMSKTDMLPSLAKLHESLLLGGTIRQEIVGRKGSVQRIKSKDREMNCPFAITGSFESVEEGLELITMQPRAIQGYNWDEATDYEESTIETSHADEWETHKLGRFVSLPQNVLLHLQRFSHQPDGRTTPINRVVNVPQTLEMARYFCSEDSRNQSHQYQLRGAILHVSEDDDDDSDGDDDEDEGGHYVSLVCLPNHTWYILDDETVTVLSAELQDVLNWLSGKSSAAIESLVPKKGTYTAVLLLYRRIDEDVVHPLLLDNLRTEIAERLQQEMDANMSLVGKRLRVRWSKGKYYAGVVTSYEEGTGKHKVRYDDGDIKEYNLKKKTIEWES